VLRDQTGTMGTTIARTRELAWHAGSLGSRLRVSVVPAEGRTTITMVRRMRARLLAAIVVTSAAAGVFTAGMIGIPIAEGLGRDAEAIGVLLGLTAGVATALKLGGAFVRRFRTRALQRLGALGDVLATKVRESIG